MVRIGVVVPYLFPASRAEIVSLNVVLPAVDL